MKKKRFVVMAAAASVALLVFSGAAPAFAEYRSFPGVNCEGYAYTTARTTAMWDYHSQSKYSSSSYDSYQFGPNYAGTVQTHNNWSSFRRTSSAYMYTTPEPSAYAIGSPRHTCDN